jgi:tRNA G18 (ribose-2'-O)-methylase SpoU
MRSFSGSGRMTGAIQITDPEDIRIDAYRNVRERDLVGRQGRFIAEGRVVLNVLVQNAPQSIESLLVLENRIEGLSELIARLPRAVPVFCAPQSVMDAIAGFHLHRGVLAVAKRAEPPQFNSLLASLGKDALVAVLAGISNHDNMGAIFRNAAAFEADAIVLDDQCCDPSYRKAIRVSVGAVLKVPHARAGTIDAALLALADAGFGAFALSPRGELPVSALPKRGRRAIVLGAEGQGLPDKVLRSVQTCRITMSPNFDSLNVGTASGLALFHASRFSV